MDLALRETEITLGACLPPSLAQQRKSSVTGTFFWYNALWRHAKLRIEGKAFSTGDTPEEYRCDVWGVHFNWLQIKDGRALTSFA